MSNPNLNPLTVVYRAFRAALLNWPAWAATVPIGDFPDMSDTKFVGFKSDVAPRDFPEVALMQGPFRFQPFGRNSKTVSIDQSFPLVMTQDKMKLVPANDLKWETLRALVHGQSAINATPYLSSWDVAQAGADHPMGIMPWTRGVARFVTALQINAKLDVPRDVILTLTSPTA